MNVKRSTSILLVTVAALGLSACQAARNFTTYYNLFYNMERIMGEVEEELLYIREQKTPEPVYYIPFDDLERRDAKFYAHLERRSMNNEEMRANKVKLDSILMKGSKLMARNAKSDYLSDAVYYIGKTYFYEREWFQSQKKCEELIAGFPESRWYPDAHLVNSMDLMQQGKVREAATMISRTIDIGWARERKDILIDAFRLNADLQIGEGNYAEALRPYERAMVLSSDDEDRARWQYEIGLIHFRRGDFQSALAAFDKASDDFSPDILTEFQLGMQRAAAMRALGQYDRARAQLAKLRGNGNFEPWYGLVELEMLNLAAAQSDGGALSETDLARVDSISPGKGYAAYALYERGVRAFRAGDLKTALENFNKSTTAAVPFQRRAQRYASLLERYFDQTGKARALVDGYTPEIYPDSLKATVAELYYNTARVFASLDIPDSVNRYYDLSYRWSGQGSAEGARVLYAWSLAARAADRSAAADSLLQRIVDDFPLTEYAVGARRSLGYTEDAKIDPAEDLFKSGVSQMNVGNIPAALGQFHRVIDKHPKSAYAPRAYYAIGLIYEKRLNDLDSAYSYYGRLIDLFPKSEQAQSVASLLQAVNMQRMRKPGNGQPNDVPTQNDAGDGSGVNMDWMKQNPPEAPKDEDEVLIPLNGDTSKLRPRAEPPKTGTKPDPKGVKAPADSKPSGTKPPATRPVGTKPTDAKPPGTKPPDTKPVDPKAGTNTPGTGASKPSEPSGEAATGAPPGAHGPK